MSKILINYTPELVDEAIKEHVAKHMQITGNVQIDYTHRRKTRKVSATIAFKNINTVESLPQYEAIEFDDLPEHEKQEAIDSNDNDDSMFGNLPNQETSDESEDLFG